MDEALLISERMGARVGSVGSEEDVFSGFFVLETRMGLICFVVLAAAGFIFVMVVVDIFFLFISFYLEVLPMDKVYSRERNLRIELVNRLEMPEAGSFMLSVAALLSKYPMTWGVSGRARASYATYGRAIATSSHVIT